MGLTIHWEAKNKEAFIDPKVARQCVEFVKEIAQREKWQILAEWDETVNPSEYKKNGTWNGKKFVDTEPSKRTETQTIGISVLPHKDSESICISFDLDSGKMMKYDDYGHSKYSYNSQFCKTHYAGFNTHRKVCRLLQAIDKHFVPLEVSDEGDYYGVWDDKKGKGNFGEYVAFVKGFGDMFTKQLINNGDNVEIYKSEDHTDGWKEEYIDHLAKKFNLTNEFKENGII